MPEDEPIFAASSAAHRYLKRYAPDVADDLLQQSLLRCLGRVAGHANPSALLLRVARNLVIDHARRSALRRDLPFVEATRLADSGASVEACLVDEECCAAIREAVCGLQGPLREVTELHFWEEQPLAAIALQLDLPLGTVKSRLRRARRILAQRLGGASLLPRSDVDGARDR